MGVIKYLTFVIHTLRERQMSKNNTFCGECFFLIYNDGPRCRRFKKPNGAYETTYKVRNSTDNPDDCHMFLPKHPKRFYL
jgi:hypothetical protein